MTSVERRSSSSGVSDGSEAFVLVRGRAEGASSASMRIVSRVAEKCRSSVDIVDRKGSSSFGQAKRRFLMVPAGRTSRLWEYSRAAVRSESAVSHYVSRCEPRTSSLHRTRSCSLLPFAQKLCAADQN